MRRFALLLTVALLTPAALAQTSATRPDPASELKQVSTMLAGSDTQVSEALAQIDTMLANDPTRAVVNVRTWAKALIDAKHYDQAAALALKGILALPGDTASVEALQTLRVRAYLAAGKPDVALSNAKSLYNVSSMATTSSALLLLAECLNATKPGDLSAVKQFRQEQINGAKYAPPATRAATTAATTAAASPAASAASQPTTEGAITSPMLKGIKIDAAPYVEPLKKMYGEDFASLMAKGNLLLLADRLADAKEIFDRAYGVGAETNLVAATESLARVMKAEDGTIGRANHFVLSLRQAAPMSGKSAKPRF